MSDNTAIEWTDATWNWVTGCTMVSDGCLNCYITRTPPLRMAGRTWDKPEVGGTTGVILHPERLSPGYKGNPLRWTRPRRIFGPSLADPFHDDIPDDFLVQVFAVMAATPQHTYVLFTKRPGRMRALLSSQKFQYAVAMRACGVHDHRKVPRDDRGAVAWPLPNVHGGVSVEDQSAAWRVHALLASPLARRIVSAEPLLGPLDLRNIDCGRGRFIDALYGDVKTADGEVYASCPAVLDWVIVGGESGPGTLLNRDTGERRPVRPMHPAWAQSLRDQVAKAPAAFFMKQLGDFTSIMPTIADPSRPDGYAPDWDRQPDVWVEAGTGRTVPSEEAVPDTGSWRAMYQVGKKAAGRELDGRTWDEFPDEVKVSQ